MRREAAKTIGSTPTDIAELQSRTSVTIFIPGELVTSTLDYALAETNKGPRCIPSMIPIKEILSELS